MYFYCAVSFILLSFSLSLIQILCLALCSHTSIVLSFLWVGYQVTHILIALAISLCYYHHQWKRSNDVAQVLCFILNFAQNKF